MENILSTPRFEVKFNSLFLLAALCYMARGSAVITLALAASVVLHECGHALTAWMFGVKVKGCGVNWFGAFIRREQSSGWREAVISLSGPAVNIALALVSTGTMARFNWILAIICLFPLKGTDGHRAWNAIR